jgi:hypothetical protein
VEWGEPLESTNGNYLAPATGGKLHAKLQHQLWLE